MIGVKYDNRDGFELCKREFALPADIASLDSQTKRDLYICQLFINQKLPISDIACTVGEDRRYVILKLLAKGILKERRIAPISRYLVERLRSENA